MTAGGISGGSSSSAFSGIALDTVANVKNNEATNAVSRVSVNVPWAGTVTYGYHKIIAVNASYYGNAGFGGSSTVLISGIRN